ncbi:HEPN/Toprim-associated domain-containing protein [Citrobacter freundii]|uniref:HEPN/Toprim-associated domain-containing protein n=1 Tax=Citrobacter freundii TaxID=546 RepID=UPI00397CB47F
MSTWTGISIGNFTLYDTQNDYHQWYFQEGDRVREIDKEEDGLWSDETFIGYRTTVAQMRRRLQLNGYDRAALERDFSTAIESWKADSIAELAELECEEPPHGEDYRQYRITWLKHVIPVLEKATLDDWLERLNKAACWASNESDFPQRLTWVETGDPVLSLMVSSVDGDCLWVRDSNFNFPCTQQDFYSLAILLITEDVAVCELDLKWLIHAGWTDDFDDLEEKHAGATQPLRHARQSLSELSALVSSAPENPVLLRMCYSGFITIMEAYLADIFIRAVKHPSVKRRFVESYEKFRGSTRKPLSDIYNQLDSLDKVIEEELFSLSFHHIPTVTKLYQECLLVSFPPDILKDIARAVIIRHDIVHRNGRDKKGKHHLIECHHVNQLEELMHVFLEGIDKQILDGLQLPFQNEKGLQM